MYEQSEFYINHNN